MKISVCSQCYSHPFTGDLHPTGFLRNGVCRLRAITLASVFTFFELRLLHGSPYSIMLTKPWEPPQEETLFQARPTQLAQLGQPYR